MCLGDAGAEVIKVEQPGKGDDTRAFGPPFVNGESTYFLSINRNKKSVAIDLKHPRGGELVKALARKSDVVVENFRPGVAKRLGLGHEALRGENPRLIYCSISGFGHAGLPEFSALPGYDAVVQGLAGLQDVTGMPDGHPTRVGVPMSDLLSGMAAFQQVLLAVIQRHHSGEGAFLDVSMLDATAAVLTFHAAAALNAGTKPSRQGNRHSSIAPYETFHASDGYFNLAVGNDEQFVALCGLLAKPEWASDARFKTNPERVRNRDALSAALSVIFATRTVDVWVTVLSEKGIPAGRIHRVDEVVKHPQLHARGKVIEVAHPVAGTLKLLGSPVSRQTSALAPPTLGQHTREVLRQTLQLETAQIEALFAERVVAGQ